MKLWIAYEGNTRKALYRRKALLLARGLRAHPGQDLPADRRGNGANQPVDRGKKTRLHSRQCAVRRGKAEKHFKTAFEVVESVGSKFYAGRAYRDMGSLHSLKSRTPQARECLPSAIRLYEKCGAETRINAN